MSSKEPELLYVTGVVPVCAACLDGEGGECHTPGCLFWVNRAPDIPIRQRIEDVGGKVRRCEDFLSPVNPEDMVLGVVAVEDTCDRCGQQTWGVRDLNDGSFVPWRSWEPTERRTKEKDDGHDGNNRS